MNYNEKLKFDVDNCVKCGTCRPVCPTFNAGLTEGAAARGKIALIDFKNIGLIDGKGVAFNKHMVDCTLCGACTEVCPHNIETPLLVMKERGDLIQGSLKGRIKGFVLSKVLGSKKLKDFLFSLLKIVRPLIFKSKDYGLESRFPIPVLNHKRLIPKLPNKDFLKTARAIDGRKSKDGVEPKRVGFFSGCGINYIVPNVGESTLNVLEDAGVEVVTPQDQLCCGMPAQAHGLRQEALDFAKENVRIFNDLKLDYIVTSCATCGHSLKNMYGELIEDTDDENLKKDFKNFSSKVRDITELLIDDLEFIQRSVGGNKSVTIHDPCHLARGQGIKSEPRELLVSGGYKIAEMENSERCCGLGGGLTFSDYDMSKTITDEKSKNIEATEAEVVATGCPGCMVQIQDGLNRNGIDKKVVHFVELLDKYR